MSHRIVYKHIAIRFGQDALNQVASPIAPFHGDRILLLELGGANNLSTRHPVTRREVGRRNWLALAFASPGEVIRDACGYAGSCETGAMRLTGERSTRPERYIRSVRNAIAAAFAPALARDAGFSTVGRIEVDLNSELGRVWAPRLASLDGLVPSETNGSVRRWRFDDALDYAQAALFLATRHAVDNNLWAILKADGPCFGPSRHVPRAA